MNMARARRRSPTTSSGQPFPVLIYEGNAMIDSGSSNHMTYDKILLTDIEPAFHQIVLPDGSDTPSDKQGILRLSVYCTLA
jgi:hypothetical protein